MDQRCILPRPVRWLTISSEFTKMMIKMIGLLGRRRQGVRIVKKNA